jgi:hypothetical protein
MNIPFLGELALDPDVRIGGDSGAPVTTRAGEDKHAAPFLELAKRVDQAVGALKQTGPTVTIED